MLASSLWFVAALVCTVAVLVVYDLWRLWREPTLHPTAISTTARRLLVVIPARNEAARIGTCLAGLAAQQHRQFRVVVVDDNSTDGTTAIARRYAADLPDLTILTGAPLPAGWAGKSWACWQGAALAHPDEDLVFLDADVVPAGGLLAALALCDADLVSLLPRQQYGSRAERTIMPVFLDLITAITPFARVNDPRSTDAFAIGQCILVRNQAYYAIGGHTAVRDSVLEDMHLARHAKSHGARIAVYAAPELVAVRMYDGWKSIVAGLGKNAVAGLRNAGNSALWYSVRASFLAWIPFWLVSAALIRPEEAGVLLGGAALCFVLATSVRAASLRRHSSAALGWACAAPVGLLLYFGIATWAILRVASGRGVHWKGRRLPGS